MKLNSAHLGTMHIFRQQKGLGELKMASFFLMFSAVFMQTYRVGGSKKVQKFADVIYGLSLNCVLDK